MTQHVHFQQAPPRSWDQFEELCADTFQEEWQDSTLVRHGRMGQTQHGVDIVGRDGANWPVAIQCKRKSVWPVSKVTTHELDEEVEKVKRFKPALKACYLVSTASDDQLLQEHARLITERHRREGLFTVAVIGWGELVVTFRGSIRRAQTTAAPGSPPVPARGDNGGNDAVHCRNSVTICGYAVASGVVTSRPVHGRVRGRWAAHSTIAVALTG